jgi:inner membrane transporter RhtA
VALEFTGPLAVSVVFSRRLRDLLWVALAALGLLALLPRAGLGASNLDPIGAALALLAGGFWALYIVFGKKAGAEGGSEVVAVGACLAALVAAPIGLIRAGPALLSPHLLPSALLVAFFSSALPYSLEMIALRRLPPGVFGSLMSLEPAVAVVMGWLVLRQTLSPLQLGAVLAVVLASAGAAVGARSAVNADPV